MIAESEGMLSLKKTKWKLSLDDALLKKTLADAYEHIGEIFNIMVASICIIGA